MAVELARTHEHGTAGFTRDLWLFATFFTLSATVWIEMLAKPGALAHAQAGLSTIPRPIKSLRRRGQRLSRYVQITRIAARNGLGRSIGVADDEEEPIEGRAPVAVRARRALEEAGGMFVKLGQVMSTRADLMPPALVEELSKLQDQVTPAPRDAVVGLIAIPGGPEFTGQTTLYEFFGYFGLFCSTILVMRVLISILRDGLN